MWMEFIFPLIWMIVVAFSMDEITVRFKFHHADKISMVYKVERDGLHTYALFQKGYTYQIFI